MRPCTCCLPVPPPLLPPLHKPVPAPPTLPPHTPPHPTPTVPAVSTEFDVATLIGRGVAATATQAPLKAGNGATIIPINEVLQYVNQGSNTTSPLRRLTSIRELLQSTCICITYSGMGASGCESALPS